MITKLIKTLFETHENKERRLTDEWLSNSESLEEIERKQRMISRGDAPWQKKNSTAIQGW